MTLLASDFSPDFIRFLKKSKIIISIGQTGGSPVNVDGRLKILIAIAKAGRIKQAELRRVVGLGRYVVEHYIRELRKRHIVDRIGFWVVISPTFIKKLRKEPNIKEILAKLSHRKEKPPC